MFERRIENLRTMLTIITSFHVFQVIVSCSRRVPIEVLVFSLFDQIAPKHAQ